LFADLPCTSVVKYNILNKKTSYTVKNIGAKPLKRSLTLKKKLKKYVFMLSW